MPSRSTGGPSARAPTPIRGCGRRPEARPPADLVAVRDVFARDVEEIRPGGRAARLRRPIGRWSLLTPVATGSPVVRLGPGRRTLAPESRDPGPAFLVATPVAVDPELAAGGDAPGAGHPDEILAGLVPVPVSLDPTRVGTGGRAPGPLDDRLGGSLGDRFRQRPPGGSHGPPHGGRPDPRAESPRALAATGGARPAPPGKAGCRPGRRSGRGPKKPEPEPGSNRKAVARSFHRARSVRGRCHKTA